MFTEEDILTSKPQSLENRRTSRLSKDVIVIEPAQTKRDLFEEDKDNDIREREADSRSKRRSSRNSKSGDVDEPDNDDGAVVEVKKDSNKSDSAADSRILNGNMQEDDDDDDDDDVGKVDDVDESASVDDNMQANVIVNTGNSQDSRRVVSDVSSVVAGDERVVEFSGGSDSRTIGDDEVENVGGDDDINIYEGMPQDIEFQADV